MRTHPSHSGGNCATDQRRLCAQSTMSFPPVASSLNVCVSHACVRRIADERGSLRPRGRCLFVGRLPQRNRRSPLRVVVAVVPSSLRRRLRHCSFVRGPQPHSELATMYIMRGLSNTHNMITWRYRYQAKVTEKRTAGEERLN